MFRRVPLQRRLTQSLAAATAIYLALSLFLAIWLIEGALHLPRIPIALRNDFADSIATFASIGVEDASQAASDGAILQAWYVQPENWNNRSVILLHGVGDNRQGVASYALTFLRAGYAVLLPDSRGHGASGGNLVTYGLLESGDVRSWSDWINARQLGAQKAKPTGCLYLFGESMGAAIALQASATTPHLCAVVAEAPFESFREIGYQRIAQGLGISVEVSHVIAWPTVNLAFAYAQFRYGLDFDQASPEKKLAQSHVPALLIAGLAETNIPLRHSQSIAARASSNSELWLVPGAGHTMSASVAPAAFQRRVLDWFSTHSHN